LKVVFREDFVLEGESVASGSTARVCNGSAKSDDLKKRLNGQNLIVKKYRSKFPFFELMQAITEESI
jgi:hypothetical protein